ncbi:30S ribosomal protein S6e [Candidatus Pacearchaeota archaeon]|nr:30S ribosomal protein S6e [Candidatus Pacearchaeota archaeon]
MTLKLNISDKGKAWKLEIESLGFINGKSIGDKLKGKEIKKELDGYELEITGGSDSSGFPMSKNVEGIGRKRLLLKKGWGMHKKPKGLKKKKSKTPKGLRLRKTVRGKIISEAISQVNIKVLKAGSIPLSQIFPEQNKTPQQSEKAPKEKQVKETEQSQEVSVPAT